MEALQLFKKINIKSRLYPYSISFTNKIKEDLEKTVQLGDILIVDEFILNSYKSIFINIKNDIISVQPNEKEKSYLALEKIINQLVSNGFRKNNTLIAIGGGIIQDITSFIAFILYRGVSWVFFPTNLLSQCDSCIGSKLSINLGAYKNLLGGFYPPKEIYIDTKFLKTLNNKDILSGLGEMLHYFLISGQKDTKLFKDKVLGVKNNLSEIDRLIYRSLQIKKAMIEIDEFDIGPRNVFNYGHTFGHALESVTNYVIPHGIAVSYGIDLANYISVKLGFLGKQERNEMREICEEIFLTSPLPLIKKNDYKNALKKDKKNIKNKIGLILSKGVGLKFKHLIDYVEIEDYINDFFDNKKYLKNI
tara:strand:+ start:3994 stop:5079 length:1086 start_codon:yes stop_codon:yes gene_type:complete